ncbi:MAG: Signal peptidase I [candidate division TM6 bacterium GW2011_GWE2_41_16]|nr:MAG: Signal peptidase I [candidate division TM6 bacterium GW2011_GWE2_41_16]
MFNRTRNWYNARSSTTQICILLFIVYLLRMWGFGLYQVPTGSMETTMLQGERFFADKFTVLFRPINRGDIITFLDPTYPYSSNKLTLFIQKYVSLPFFPQYRVIPIFGGPSNWTKRVIGIPGDRVQGMIEDGKPVVYLNGKKLDEPYLNKYPLIAVWKRMDEHTGDWEYFSRNQYLLDDYIAHRSYDESKAYEEQPFYHLSTDRIIQGNFIEKMLKPGTPTPKDIFDRELGVDEYWLMGDNRMGSWDSRGWGPLKGSLIHGHVLFRIWSLDSAESWPIVELIKHPIDFFKRIRWNRMMQRVS